MDGSSRVERELSVLVYLERVGIALDVSEASQKLPGQRKECQAWAGVGAQKGQWGNYDTISCHCGAPVGEGEGAEACVCSVFSRTLPGRLID